MNEERLKDDEYEKQYYSFSSTELYEDLKGQVCIAVKKALKEMDAALAEQVHDEVFREEKIKEIYKIFMDSAKVPLQKFKEEARKIFAIPRNVILEEDKYNTSQYSDEDIVQLKKEVAELEKELLQEQVLLETYKQQKEIVDTMIKPVYEKVNGIIRFLKNVSENKENEKNEKKIIDLHEQHIQYYFNSEHTITESAEFLALEQKYIRHQDVFK